MMVQPTRAFIASLATVLVLLTCHETVEAFSFSRHSHKGLQVRDNLAASCWLSSTRLAAAPQENGVENDMVMLEKEIISSVQEKLDKKRVVEALLEDDLNDPLEASSSWNIPTAGALVASGLSFALLHNLSISAVVLVSVFIAASGDPSQEDGLAGAMARILGRYTIKSVQESQPKIRAIARAVVTGEEEIVGLKERISELEEQNTQLRRWKRTHEALPNYTLDGLKMVAQENSLAVGGTKAQLLMRLVEAGVVRL